RPALRRASRGSRCGMESASSERELERPLEQVAEPGQELRTVRAVDDTVVARESDGPQGAGEEAAVRVLDRGTPDAPDREDRRLRRVDDRGEGPHAEHAEVRDRERSVAEVRGR